MDLEHPYYDNSIVDLFLRIIEDVYFNAFILFIIICNTIVLCMDKYPEHDPQILAIFKICNLLFTIVFTCELILKFVALGFRPFFRDGFNIFDFIIVFTSIQGIVLELSETDNDKKGKNSYLLILRTFRCFRIFKLFKIGDLRVLIDSQV